MTDANREVGFDDDFEDLDYNPLEDVPADEFVADGEEDEDFAEDAGQLGPTAGAQIRRRSIDADLPAEQRIANLFERFATRRRVLLGILDFVSQPQRADALKAEVERLQEFDRSVYQGYDFSLLLEEAGAIAKVDEAGQPWVEGEEAQPEIVEEDGVRFYKPGPYREVYWVITPEGAAYVAADDPWGRLQALFAAEEKYLPVYKSVLVFCAEDGGRSVGDVDVLVNKSPLSRNPMRHCTSFLKKLEDCGATVWAGNWSTTALGRRALEELLADVDGIDEGEE